MACRDCAGGPSQAAVRACSLALATWLGKHADRPARASTAPRTRVQLFAWRCTPLLALLKVCLIPQVLCGGAGRTCTFLIPACVRLPGSSAGTELLQRAAKGPRAPGGADRAAGSYGSGRQQGFGGGGRRCRPARSERIYLQLTVLLCSKRACLRPSSASAVNAEATGVPALSTDALGAIAVGSPKSRKLG